MNIPFAPGQEVAVNGHPYIITKFIGHGKGGYSFLAQSPLHRVPSVLKQIHHEACSYYNFGDKLQSELDDYQKLLKAQAPLPKMIEFDKANERLVKEYIEGPTVFELVEQELLPKECWQEIRQISQRMRQAQLNIDYFPSNFILSQAHLYYIDYECNDFMEEWSFEHWGQLYWSKTPQFLEYLQQRDTN